EGRERGADIPRRTGDGRRDGCGAGVGGEPPVGASGGPGLPSQNGGAMKTIAGVLLVALTLCAQQAPPAGRGGRGGPPVAPLEESGFKPIFDGKSLSGWDCDPNFWRVEGDALVGETAAGHQPKQ